MYRWFRSSASASQPGRDKSHLLGQIIVAHELTQCGNDQAQLVPLIEATANNLGRKPKQASADSGYCSEANLEALEARGVDGYVAPGCAKHPTAANGKAGGPLTSGCGRRSTTAASKRPTDCESKWWNRCSDRSNSNLLKLFTLANAA
jgi:hypothetical protein